MMSHTSTASHFLAHKFLHRYLLGVMALIGLLFGGVAARVDAGEMAPGQLVKSNTQRVIHALSERRAEFQSNPAALHSFIRAEFAQIFDRVYSARLVLGDNGRTASDADLRAFADALGESLMNRYGNSLLKVNPGLNIKVTSEMPLRDGTIVKVMSLIDRTTGAPVAVDYLLHQNAGKWQVFDVVVEGISFVQTFRIMFADDLRAKSLAQITEELRNDKIKVNTGRSNGSSSKQ